MQVEKQTINIGKTIYEGEIKTSAEGSIIVPDTKPDILKVMQVSGEAYLCEKYIEDGKITVKGKVRVNVLYLPESETGKVCSLFGVFDFCETLKRSEFRENMTFSAFCDVDKISYKLINSRKIGIDAKVIVDISVVANTQMEMILANSLENSEKKEEIINFCINNSCETFEFSIDDVIEFPDTKKVNEILKYDISVSDKEYKGLNGKLVVKGKILAEILYIDSENNLSHSEYEMPFTEVFDIDEIQEESDMEVSYEIGDTKCELKGDNNANITSNIIIGVKTTNSEAVNVLSDCYFTDFANELLYEKVKIEDVVCRVEYTAILKHILQKEASAPDILGVYKVQAKPYITATKIENNKLYVSGKVLVYVLYLTENNESSIAVIKEEIPFNYTIDCENNISDNNKVVLGIECEHISYTISSKDTVEIRCGLFISGKIMDIYDKNIITDIKLTPYNKTDSGIMIYFIKQGDSLWEIGKNYKVSIDDILLANGIDENYIPKCGEKIIIPIS